MCWGGSTRHGERPTGAWPSSLNFALLSGWPRRLAAPRHDGFRRYLPPDDDIPHPRFLLYTK